MSTGQANGQAPQLQGFGNPGPASYAQQQGFNNFYNQSPWGNQSYGQPQQWNQAMQGAWGGNSNSTQPYNPGVSATPDPMGGMTMNSPDTGGPNAPTPAGNGGGIVRMGGGATSPYTGGQAGGNMPVPGQNGPLTSGNWGNGGPPIGWVPDTNRTGGVRPWDAQGFDPTHGGTFYRPPAASGYPSWNPYQVPGGPGRTPPPPTTPQPVQPAPQFSGSRMQGGTWG